jgi:hypothetical protein
VLIELGLLDGADACSESAHVAADEIDQALAEPTLAFGLGLRRRVRADDRVLEQEVERENRIDDLRDGSPTLTERQRLPRAELLVADRQRNARNQRCGAEPVLDSQELVE